MPLTHDVMEVFHGFTREDPAYREALLREAMELLLAGDLQATKSVLRDYVHATVGFTALGEALGLSPKSLMRMLSTSGNPQAKNLLAILSHLQRAEGISAQVTTRRKDAA